MKAWTTLFLVLSTTLAMAQSALGLRFGLSDIRFLPAKVDDIHHRAEYAAHAGMSVGIEWLRKDTVGHVLAIAIQRDRMHLNYDVAWFEKVGGSAMVAQHTIDRYGLKAGLLWRLAGKRIKLLGGPGLGFTGMLVRSSTGRGHKWQVVSGVNPATGVEQQYAKWEDLSYDGR